jgi:hypothetical protein
MRLQCVSFQISTNCTDFHEIYGMSVMPLQAIPISYFFFRTFCNTNPDKALNSRVKATLAQLKTKTNSVVLVRKRTIPTKRPPLLGEVSANFSG